MLIIFVFNICFFQRKADDLNINENDSKIIKRKKKTSLEDTIPVYMQEAFFGANMIAKSKESNGNFSLEEEFEENKIRPHLIDNHSDNNNHRISLDENMLKSAQQNKKGHLELGIEGIFCYFSKIIFRFYSKTYFVHIQIHVVKTFWMVI